MIRLSLLYEAPGVFMELVSTGNYLRGAGEQARTFGDLGSTAKTLRITNQGFGEIIALFQRSREYRSPPLPCIASYMYFPLTKRIYA